MSVSGYMYNINATKKLGEVELKEGLEGNRSWHHQFSHSAYIFVGGLHHGLTEGDVVIVFSQFGEIADINLIRDKTTGKSKGFAFVCYEDQRSTVLAVDNMNGYQLLNKTLRVDHCEKYRAPKVLDENERDEDGDPKLLEYKATGAEGVGHRIYNVLGSQRKIAEVQALRQSKLAVQTAPEDEDEAWAKAFEEGLKSMDAEGLKAKKKDKKKKKTKKKKTNNMFKKELNDIRRMKKEARRLKEETKKAKEAAKMNKKEGKGKKEQRTDGKHDDKKMVSAPKSEDASEPTSDSPSSTDDESSDATESSDDEALRKRSRK